jgi:glycosyltransferase involved in cell wall biosynthesis
MTSLRSTSQAPRVSVVMAVYNGERYLSEAIESVLCQTFADFEFLIHDDGSTDGSPAVLGRYTQTDARISVSSEPNSGLPASLNKLIGRAKASLIARMDADDICRPERLEHQLNYMDAHPDISVLGSFIRYIDKDGRPVRDMDHPLTHEKIDARNLAGGTALVHPTVMFRTEAIRAVGGYDESFPNAEDLDLWLRVGEKFRLGNYPQVLLDYRFHPFSISGTLDGNSVDNTRARMRAVARRGLPESSVTPLAPWAWRPAPDRRSQSNFAVQWAWQSLNAGYPDTSRHYFLKALKLAPLSRMAWHGFIFGLLRDKGKKQ